MTKIAYGIDSWSGKIFKARRSYRCTYCEGIIPAGTKYVRHVVRLGVRKGIDPLKNLHVHIDCMAPWYQPEVSKRLYYLGRLPGQTPPLLTSNPDRHYHKPSIAITNHRLGTLMWQPPATLAAKLAFMPNQSVGQNAMAEIESCLEIVLTALVEAAGSQRKSMKLNHQIEAIALTLDHSHKSQKENE